VPALQWCGPCKLIYPQLVKLSAEMAPAAVVVKLNCNQANKELAKSLGIKVSCSSG
jgi:thioredoxin 1